MAITRLLFPLRCAGKSDARIRDCARKERQEHLNADRGCSGTKLPPLIETISRVRNAGRPVLHRGSRGESRVIRLVPSLEGCRLRPMRPHDDEPDRPNP